jgi:light-regulated signal transduction histidine kinase (bacteriophytochrome)
MKKETAVEWLIDELRKVIVENGRLDAISISQLKMKAKAMEKENIIVSYDEGNSEWTYNKYDNGNDYYQQNFGL